MKIQNDCHNNSNNGRNNISENKNHENYHSNVNNDDINGIQNYIKCASNKQISYKLQIFKKTIKIVHYKSPNHKCHILLRCLVF